MIAGSGSGLLGPAIGGALVVGIGAPWAMRLRRRQLPAERAAAGRRERLGAGRVRARQGAASSFLSEMRGGLREVTSRRWLSTEIVYMCLGNILAASFPVLAPLICRQHYGGAAAYASLVGRVRRRDARRRRDDAQLQAAPPAARRRARVHAGDAAGRGARAARADLRRRRAAVHLRRRHDDVQHLPVDRAAGADPAGGDVTRELVRVRRLAVGDADRLRAGRPAGRGDRPRAGTDRACAAPPCC